LVGIGVDNIDFLNQSSNTPMSIVRFDISGQSIR